MRHRTQRSAKFYAGTPAGAKLQRILAAALALGCAYDLGANPQGLTVTTGTATMTVSGSQVDITASHNAFLNWQSFNLAPGETTTFHQPDAASIVWNRINDPNPSQIWGHLNANGVVVLMNQSGFYFGPGSVVNAAGFVATTATTLPEFNSGANWQFNGPPPLASIVNFGNLNVNAGGSLFLIAEKIENHGVLTAPDGTLGLYAGKNVLMSERPDGRGLSVQVELPEGSVDNTGRLVADAGSILLHAQTVNQNGLLQANSVAEHNGVIELVASDALNLGANSVIQARGDDAAVSGGGQITIKSDNRFSDANGSTISIAGGASGGNGGQVEISAPFMPAIYSQIIGSAAAGYAGGSLLIDPRNITIGNTGAGTVPPDGTVPPGGPPAAGTLALNVNSAFIGLSQIRLQATANITLATGTTWDLAASTGINAPGSRLSLEAGGDIIVQNLASIRAGDGWSVSLAAGRDFTTPAGILAGIGNITLQGNGAIEARDGSISLLAGRNITVGSGFVRTVNGGSIDVLALTGSVNTGTKANGFQFLPGTPANHDYLLVDPDLGGISTAAGGNVSITAGQDITSLLPTGVQTFASDAGCGAFGAQAGNVTLNAGGNITGHYVVRNGTGTITAGQNAGTTSRQLALSLVAGGWNVNAGQNILLQEVRNPNGIFNSLGLANSPTKHYFDYAPDAYVRLNAGNGVSLLGAALPRRSGLFEQSIPSIYAPTLDITAGAGGVTIANNVILFPSPVGQLNITTTAGGSLTGARPGDLAQLIMSDSARSQYTSASSFGPDDHAPSPLHVNDPDPVRLDIAGDLSGMLLVFPKHAEINVGGDMINSRFDIQNLHGTDATTVNVAGDILNRNEFTSEPLATAPDFTPFDRVDPLSLPPGVTAADLASLANRFLYDPVAHTLTFQGRMTSTELQLLLSVRAQELDPIFGTPVVDADGNPVYVNFSILNATAAQALFAQSQDVPLNPNTGYVINGPGTLNLNAHNLDLGATLGIQSVGAGRNHALAPLGAFGAAINVNLTGNLDMFSTTISSHAGGDISVNALGNINVGSANFTGNDSLARGIFTVAKSDVTVIAGGDINVAGSRIAAYDGGNVRVMSLDGNIDAGRGGSGAVSVEKVIVVPVEDPVTHEITYEVRTYAPTIPLSGILAASFPLSLDPNFPSSENPVGSIDVEAPHGNVTANGGGIVQLALNGKFTTDSKITVVAGTTEKIRVERDAAGNVIHGADGKPIPVLDAEGNFIPDADGVEYATHPGDIDCSGAGVIGYFVDLKASRNLTGIVFSTRDVTFTVGDTANVTAISGGKIQGNAEHIIGILVGSEGISAAGGGEGLKTLSQDGGVGFALANAAGVASQGAASSSEAEAKKVVSKEGVDSADDKKKKGTGNGPVLARRVGRVTVILPRS